METMNVIGEHQGLGIKREQGDKKPSQVCPRELEHQGLGIETEQGDKKPSLLRELSTCWSHSNGTSERGTAVVYR